MQRNLVGYEFSMGILLILLCLGSTVFHAHQEGIQKRELVLEQTRIQEEQTRVTNTLILIQNELQKAMCAIVRADQMIVYNSTSRHCE